MVDVESGRKSKPGAVAGLLKLFTIYLFKFDWNEK